MRQDRMLDPHNQPNTAAERRLGVTPQREQNRAQERAGRYQENKGLAIVDDEGRLIGELIRELAIIGSGATVTVQGNRVTIDVSAGGGGTTIAVQEGDVTESLTVSVLDFDDSSFDVSISPAGEANVDLAYGTGAGQPAEGNHTHAGGSLEVQKEDTSVATGVSVIDFSQSFLVTESPTGEINVDIDGTPETVDLGSTPRHSGQFTILDAALTTSKRVIVYHHGTSATDDEPEMDAIICVPNAPTAGQVIVSWMAVPGPVSGDKTFRYIITS